VPVDQRRVSPRPHRRRAAYTTAGARVL